MQTFRKLLCIAVSLIIITGLFTGCKTAISLNNNEPTDEHIVYESCSIVLLTAEATDLTSIASSDLSLSQALESIIEEILKSKKIRTEIDRKFPNINYTLSLEAIEGTETYRVIATGENPKNLTEICDTATVLLCEHIPKIIVQCSCHIVNPASSPITRSE